jgi:acyl dehydratase
MTAATLSISDLRACARQGLGVSFFHDITRDIIDRFADATADHQWIHTDPERAWATRVRVSLSLPCQTRSAART